MGDRAVVALEVLLDRDLPVRVERVVHTLAEDEVGRVEGETRGRERLDG
jgi:hypothetical protein